MNDLVYITLRSRQTLVRQGISLKQSTGYDISVALSLRIHYLQGKFREGYASSLRHGLRSFDIIHPR